MSLQSYDTVVDTNLLKSLGPYHEQTKLFCHKFETFIQKVFKTNIPMISPDTSAGVLIAPRILCKLVLSSWQNLMLFQLGSKEPPIGDAAQICNNGLCIEWFCKLCWRRILCTTFCSSSSSSSQIA